MKKNKWLAAHLYYSYNLHKFLVEAVKPFKEKVLKENLAEGYFFIRYWEKGSHIRLRFKGDEDVLCNVLKPMLDEYFKDYFSKFPSSRSDNTELENDGVKKELLFPSNSLQYIEYEPEIERYGGNNGMLISERLFEMSSDSALQILADTNVDDYDSTGERAIGAAIQLHLAALTAFKYSRKEIICLFDMIFNDWIPAAYRVFSKDENISFTTQEANAHKESMTGVFRSQAETLKAQLKPFIMYFTEALENNCTFDENWINKWFNDMKIINTELDKSIENNLVIIPAWFANNNIEKALNIKNYLMKSYIHMTNNRVGVLNHNESFIAFLIKEFLKDD